MRPGDTPMMSTPTRTSENSEAESSNAPNGEGSSVMNYVEVDLDDSRPIFGPSCQLEGDEGASNKILVGFMEGPNRLKKLFSDIKGNVMLSIKSNTVNKYVASMQLIVILRCYWPLKISFTI